MLMIITEATTPCCGVSYCLMCDTVRLLVQSDSNYFVHVKVLLYQYFDGCNKTTWGNIDSSYCTVVFGVPSNVLSCIILYWV
jgi:hypothetical protein